MLLSKKTIRTLGFIFTTIAVILCIIAIVIAGVMYKYVGPHFRSNPFHAIPQLSVASIVVTFFVLGLTYAAFYKPNINFTIAISVLMLISLLWNFSVGVYSIVGGRPGWARTYEGCQAQYNGVIGVFNNIDVYLQNIDQNLCSSACPCFISNATGFASNTTVSSFYNLWTKTNTGIGATAFQNCSQTLQNFAFSEAVRRDPKFDPDSTFNTEKFMDYFQRLENDWECTGWCQIEYFNPNYNRNVYISKYLFTDVNRGVPKYFGCINQVFTWISGMLQGYGSTQMVLFGTQMALFALLICQAWAREKDHENQIPHHHDDNRQA